MRYVVVDVFTEKPLEGNQLGVFLDARSLSSEQMQRLAREMNFAESVFVLPPGNGADARIRIFTPATELPFAGHPVLGSAFVVGEQLPGNAVVRLETGIGVVPIELNRKGSQIVFGRMRQPIPTWTTYDREKELLAALGQHADTCKEAKTCVGCGTKPSSNAVQGVSRHGTVHHQQHRRVRLQSDLHHSLQTFRYALECCRREQNPRDSLLQAQWKIRGLF